jgi:hypothetical protein
MSAPDRIWAWVKMQVDGSAGGAWTDAPYHPNAAEYRRADLCDPMQDPRVKALETASRVAIARLDYSADTFQDQGCLTRTDACRDAAADLRAALRKMAGGE